MGNCKLTHKFDGEMLFCDAQEETQPQNSTPTTNAGNKLLRHGSSKHKYRGFKVHVSCFRGLLLLPSSFTSVLSSYMCCNLLAANIAFDSFSRTHLARKSVVPASLLSRMQYATKFSQHFDAISDNSLQKAKIHATLIKKNLQIPNVEGD